MRRSALRVGMALRSTATVALLQGLGHGAVFASTQPRHGAAEAAVIGAMRGQSFDFRDFVSHRYWDLYYGYGLVAVVFALFITVALWLTSGLAEEPQQARRFTGCIGVALAIHSASIARYFFNLPLEFDLAVIAGASIRLLLNRSSATTVEPES